MAASSNERLLGAGPPAPDEQEPARVLIVEDEVLVMRSFVRVFRQAGYHVESAESAAIAQAVMRRQSFDLVVSDIDMPGGDGIQLLRAVRQYDSDVPFLLVTGSPSVETAMKAMEYGALRYMAKPVDRQVLLDAAAEATRRHRVARLKKQAIELMGQNPAAGDRGGLEATFESALRSLWMAYQPIVRYSEQKVYAYEALVRCEEPRLPNPGVLFDAAERLHCLTRVGLTIRSLVASVVNASPADHVFINLHPLDLLDRALYSPDAPLSRVAGRVVLEITERAALDEIGDVEARMRALRELGFRIAVDDLGAGYAGLSSFAQLAPEVVKLDMSLIRGIDRERTKQKLVRSMVVLCADMGTMLVAEGVETTAERDALVEVGCDLFQGYLFAKPGRDWPKVKW